MKRLMLATCYACVFGLAGVAGAQGVETDNKTMDKEMKVTGCVAQGWDMSHYMLNNAMMSNMDSMKKDTTKTTDMKKDDMKAMSYVSKRHSDDSSIAVDKCMGYVSSGSVAIGK